MHAPPPQHPVAIFTQFIVMPRIRFNCALPGRPDRFTPGIAVGWHVQDQGQITFISLN